MIRLAGIPRSRRLEPLRNGMEEFERETGKYGERSGRGL